MSRVQVQVVLARTAIATGALLAGSCAAPEPALDSTPSEEVESARAYAVDLASIREEIQIEKNKFGPDVALRDSPNLNAEVWALIDAADPYGITVQGVKEGDTIAIESIGGIAWFSDQSIRGTVFSIIYGVASQLIPAGPLSDITQTVGKEVGLEDNQDKPDREMARDGYGRNLGNGNYAENEGGIVVCMPSAYGPMYANAKNHLDGDAVSQGRFEKYVKSDSDMKGRCFFPTRIDREEDSTLVSVMEKTAQQDGVLHMFAFDREYEDNAGNYQVKFRITRSQ